MFYVFSGSDLVEWLFTHVEGFADRRDARKYACNLLKAGFIRHTVNKITFSEQCYYVFGDLSGGRYFMSRFCCTCAMVIFARFIFSIYLFILPHTSHEYYGQVACRWLVR